MEEDIKRLFDIITNTVRQTIYYVPRNYETIGGRWTVDTYKAGNVKVQIMDEGWTIKLTSPGIEAIDSGGNFKVEKGTVEDFRKLARSLN